MDPTLPSLLDSIPQKPPRSKLETHRELIRQLRKGCLSLPVRHSPWASSWVIGSVANGEQHRQCQVRFRHNRSWPLPTYRHRPLLSDVQSTIERRPPRQGTLGFVPEIRLIRKAELFRKIFLDS